MNACLVIIALLCSTVLHANDEAAEVKSFYRQLYRKDRALALYHPCILPTDSFDNTNLASLFGMRNHPIRREFIHHNGIDISVKNANVLSTAKGQILEVGFNNGYGNYVKIDHLNGFVTLYGHLSRVVVKEGQYVDIAQKIGVSGSTGRVTGEHIHYEVIYNNTHRNPLYYLLLLYDNLYPNH